MPALLLTLLPLLAQHAPDLIGLAMGGRAADVAKRVEATVTRVFGTTDHDAIQQQIAADPTKADTLKAQLAADVEALKVQTADVADARAAQGRLVEAKSVLAYMPAAWTIMVVVCLLAMVAPLILIKSELTTNQVTIITMILGALLYELARCGNFWLGTSSSAIKRGDQALDAAYQATPPAGRRSA